MSVTVRIWVSKQKAIRMINEDNDQEGHDMDVNDMNHLVRPVCQFVSVSVDYCMDGGHVM